MTFRSSIAAVDLLPRSPLFGIARFHVNGRPIEFDISHEDMERDTAWAAGLLRRFGTGPGQALLVIGGLHESPWLGPFTRAARSLGATVAHSDRWGWDARRSEMFVRRLPVGVVIGLTGEVTESLSRSGLLGGLATVPHLLARPDAVASLTAAGLEPGVFAKIGPLAAVASGPGEPLEYDATEWKLEVADGADEGDLLVSTIGTRAASLSRVPIGVRGRLISPGQLRLAELA